MPDRTAQPTVDQLFGLFCTSGRPRYLAEVFDATAPELIRVATHITRDPAAAEDLVQSTYLEAIRAARRYEPGRRVLPWLLGILGNLAREARRRDDRRVAPERVESREPTDPASDAALGELSSAVDEAIDGLPEAYRPVLVLHLGHGMAPGEIAHALRRPPGTVRSQLARGLKLLRRALPASFAGALAMAVLPGRGLAAVRRAVMFRATLAAPPMVAAALVTQLTTKPIAALTAVALAALVAWGGWRGLDTPNSEPGPPRQSVSLGVDRDADSGDLPAGTERSATRRERLRRDPATPAATGRLVVRVRAGGNDRVGVMVRAAPEAKGDLLLSELTRRTDPDGVATFAAMPAGPVRVRLDRSAGPVVDVRAGERTEVEVDLTVHSTVHGVVVDAAGRPVSGAAIWIAERGLADQAVIGGHADREGRFRLAGVASSHLIAALADDFQPCAPQESEASKEMRLVLRRGAMTVVGTVTDESGRPVEGALVRIGREGPPFHLLDRDGGAMQLVTNLPPVTVRTDAAGRYETRSAMPQRRLSLFARAPGRVGARATVAGGAGATMRHDFVLRAGCEVTGRVSARGEPVAGITMMVDMPTPGEPVWMSPSARTDHDGRYRLRGVAPGDVRITALPKGAAPVFGHVRANARLVTRWDIDLENGPTLAGRLVDPAGRPMRGVTVRAEGQRVLSTTTDEQGRFRFSTPARVEHQLMVCNPESPVPAWFTVATRVRAHDKEQQFVVDHDVVPSASLRGLVQAPGGTMAADTSLRVRHHTSLRWVDIAVDPLTGAFEATPLVPGCYEVRVVAPGWPTIDPGPVHVTADQRTDLGTLAQQAGAPIDIRVIAQGEAAAGPVRIRVHDGRGRTVYRHDHASPDHRTGPIPTGTWQLTVSGPSIPILTASAAVTANGTNLVEIDAHGGHEQRVEITRADGTPWRAVEEMHVQWLDAGGALLTEQDIVLQDTVGAAIERLLLPGAYTVRVRTSDGRAGETSLRVEARAVTVPAQLVLRD